MMKERKTGVLMPIFSLPGPYGIGCLGEEAYAFADFLHRAGQRYWQILPVGPTGFGDSPYQSFSTFAGNPYFIDLKTLQREGLLREAECEAYDWGGDSRCIDYEKLYLGRFPLFERALERFVPDEDYQHFLEKEAFWLEGYVRFMERKEGRSRDYYQFLQYQFFRQWKRFKTYVNSLGIQLIGDIPIYVAMDSSDVESDSRLFQLESDGTPKAVAGCPPDAFAAKGQLWGNPLYDWSYHKKTGYAWWIQRMDHCFSLYDILRVDHFRGFDEYFSIPYGAEDASGGHWEKGPGIQLFTALKEALGDQQIIAEDLGYLTDSVVKLVQDTGYPGMKIMEFAFDSREAADYRPCTWSENCVAYTGTHDNQTLKAWFDELTPEDRRMAADYLGQTVYDLATSDYVYQFIRLTLDSVANTTVIPMQDYLRLGAEARINQPSTLGKNWTYRFGENDFTVTLAADMRRMAEESGRF